MGVPSSRPLRLRAENTSSIGKRYCTQGSVPLFNTYYKPCCQFIGNTFRTFPLLRTIFQWIPTLTWIRKALIWRWTWTPPTPGPNPPLWYWRCPNIQIYTTPTSNINSGSQVDPRLRCPPSFKMGQISSSNHRRVTFLTHIRRQSHDLWSLTSTMARWREVYFRRHSCPGIQGLEKGDLKANGSLSATLSWRKGACMHCRSLQCHEKLLKLWEWKGESLRNLMLLTRELFCKFWECIVVLNAMEAIQLVIVERKIWQFS